MKSLDHIACRDPEERELPEAHIDRWENKPMKDTGEPYEDQLDTDWIPAVVAARIAGVSKQAVSDRIRRGTLTAKEVQRESWWKGEGKGTHVKLVRLGDVKKKRKAGRPKGSRNKKPLLVGWDKIQTGSFLKAVGCAYAYEITGTKTYPGGGTQYQLHTWDMEYKSENITTKRKGSNAKGFMNQLYHLNGIYSAYPEDILDYLKGVYLGGSTVYRLCPPPPPEQTELPETDGIKCEGTILEDERYQQMLDIHLKGGGIRCMRRALDWTECLTKDFDWWEEVFDNMIDWAFANEKLH